VGSRHFNSFGAHGASEHVHFAHYATLDECCRDLKQNKGDPRQHVAVAALPASVTAAEACCTCAQLLPDTLKPYGIQSARLSHCLAALQDARWWELRLWRALSRCRASPSAATPLSCWATR
jgi:hypothetical protein